MVLKVLADCPRLQMVCWWVAVAGAMLTRTRLKVGQNFKVMGH